MCNRSSFGKAPSLEDLAGSMSKGLSEASSGMYVLKHYGGLVIKTF